MDHDQAVEMQASMKYALGDLAEGDRDAFEEHFADCSQCLNDVEAAAVFAANTRAVLREKPAPRLVESAPPQAQNDSRNQERNSWWSWRPAFAFSAGLNLALAAIAGFAILQRPAMAPDVASSPQLVEYFAVHGTTRGAGQVVRTSGHPVVLSFDLPEHYDRYVYAVTQSGSEALSGEVRAAGGADSLNLEVPVAKLKTGEYDVTLTGKSGSKKDLLGSCRLVVDGR